jgi:hypothetical protein
LNSTILAQTPDEYHHIYDLCARYLARDTTDQRHAYLGVIGAERAGQVSEAWRFPVVEAFHNGNADESIGWNKVTFIYAVDRSDPADHTVSVAGLLEVSPAPIPMTRVEDSIYYTVSMVVPAARRYKYAFVVDGKVTLDPVNPQRFRAANGEVLSTFFTYACFEPVTFERWERLTNHILPFNTHEADLFFDRLSAAERRETDPYRHRFDRSVGVVNFLDKLLAREERHQLPAYKACLAQINRIIRQRNPYQEPRDMPEQMFVDLYNQMASDMVPGWDLQAYGSPAYFLYLLRRHTFCGAFCHPKYGGNAGATGWAWLSERFRDSDGKTLFDWRRALEQPLGTNAEYRG